MGHLTKDFLDFFKELSANNSKAWMDANRKRYEKSVRDSFKDFVEDMILRIRQYDEEVGIESKEAVFRINNDIRFNPDKPLYKNYMAAVISKYGRKEMSYPGFYFQLGPEKVMVAGGAYSIDKKDLNKLRKFIAREPERFYKLLKEKSFKKFYGEVQGEENKRLTGELKDAAKDHPVLFKKQFYYMAEMSSDNITDEDFPEKLMEYWHAGRPFNNYLIEAMY